MTGLSSDLLRSVLITVSRQRNIAVAAATVCTFATFTVMHFGVVFNYTHSAPFGLYRRISDFRPTQRDPAPYVFFCPDVRWQSMKDQPNYRKPMHTCPDGFAPLIKPVIAWPGDIVETSSTGISVNGQSLLHTAPIEYDSDGRHLHPFPLGRYVVQENQLWVVSSFSPRSFDSRYFGPIPVRSVRSWVKPFFVERYNQALVKAD